MNWARTFMLLGLAVVVVLFVATWFTIPSGRFERKNSTTGEWETARLSYPARLFRVGLVERRSVGNFVSEVVYRQVDLHTVRQRVVIFYGGLAVVIVLIGAAFGAFRRKPAAAVRESW